MPEVEKLNYIASSLRKNRVEAFQTDIQRVYDHYQQSIKSIMIQQLTISAFTDFWSAYNMQFIFQCLSEQQSEDEFAQMMYEVVLKKYFLYKQKQSKIFAIFALYFLHYACQNRKRINICPMYMNQLRKFVLENRNDKCSDYMKIAYQLHQKCFNFCIKVGLSNPIVKGNGDIPRKPVIVRVDPFQKINQIQTAFGQWNSEKSNESENSKISLKQALSSYDKLKKDLFKDNKVNKDKFPLDTYFVNRIEKMVKNYKQFVQNMETPKRKQEQIQ